MSGWINLATTFPRHPKALAAGPVARHLFIVGLCWAGEYDTDGAIPAYALNSLAIDAGISSDDVGQTADRLVEVGLWVRNADGWQVHDWGQWQSTSAEREERRSKNRERQAKWRERQANKPSDQVSDDEPTSDGDDVSDASRNALVTAPKSKSTSTPKDLSSSLMVPSPETPFGSGTDGFIDLTVDERITLTFDAWLNHQAASQGIPEGKRRRGYVQQALRTIDQHLPALKALVQQHPTQGPEALAALYRQPKARTS
jgi:hypothetical protein